MSSEVIFKDGCLYVRCRSKEEKDVFKERRSYARGVSDGEKCKIWFREPPIISCDGLLSQHLDPDAYQRGFLRGFYGGEND